jgi:hypothetical protein
METEIFLKMGLDTTSSDLPSGKSACLASADAVEIVKGEMDCFVAIAPRDDDAALTSSSLYISFKTVKFVK